MDGKAVVETLEAMAASLAALAGCAGRAAGNGAPAGADLLRDEADACLDGLAVVAGLDARIAALKVHFAAGYAHAAAAVAAPALSPQGRTARDMAVTAEVACVLTVSERSAAALLGGVGRPDGRVAADARCAPVRDRVVAARPGDV